MFKFIYLKICVYYFAFISSFGICEEITTTTTEISSISLNNNSTKEFSLNNLTTERIIQPVSHQTQQIDRKILKPSPSDGRNQLVPNQTEFRPSPQLETYYEEFNKFPVIPALPESKHKTATNGFGGELSYLRDLPVTSTESPWISRIKFPPTTSQDYHQQPYKFSTNFNEKSQGKSFGNLFDFHRNKPSNFHQSLSRPPTEPVDNKFQFNAPVISGGNNWDKFEKDHYGSGAGYKNRRPVTSAGNYGYLPDKSYDSHKTSYDNPPEKTHSHSLGPWKEIIKILTTVIPIGLLISALTPTFITVTSVNDTQTRLRIDDKINYFHQLNLDGCEDRIMCELLLSATKSKDAEKHLNNLLETFTKNHSKIVEQADRMKKIFEAVKNQNCSNIICTKIKDRG